MKNSYEDKHVVVCAGCTREKVFYYNLTGALLESSPETVEESKDGFGLTNWVTIGTTGRIIGRMIGIETANPRARLCPACVATLPQNIQTVIKELLAIKKQLGEKGWQFGGYPGDEDVGMMVNNSPYGLGA